MFVELELSCLIPVNALRLVCARAIANGNIHTNKNESRKHQTRRLGAWPPGPARPPGRPAARPPVRPPARPPDARPRVEPAGGQLWQPCRAVAGAGVLNLTTLASCPLTSASRPLTPASRPLMLASHPLMLASRPLMLASRPWQTAWTAPPSPFPSRATSTRPEAPTATVRATSSASTFASRRRSPSAPSSRRRWLQTARRCATTPILSRAQSITACSTTSRPTRALTSRTRTRRPCARRWRGSTRRPRTHSSWVSTPCTDHTRAS